MSVINKMLRDLDARRSAGDVPDRQRAPAPAAMQGTSSVALPGTSIHRPRRRMALVLLLFVALLLAFVWYLDATQPVLPPQVVVAPPAPPLPPPVVQEVAPQALAQTASAPAGAAPAEPPPEPAVAPVPSASTGERAVPRKRRRSVESAATDSLPVPPAPDAARQSESSAAVSTAAPTAMPASAPAAASLAERRQSAALETLAQAQSLWNAGSREAALALVREAVLTVERAQAPDPGLLTQLVREQVRMELALGRPGDVLALLARLEPQLSGQADLWAVRGNAAQRLGRHPEAVQAYRAALQLRPGEQRWLLGVAVSLAALGRVEEAAVQAEQARLLGPVSPEVLAYLRQAGVPLRCGTLARVRDR